jgi:hypothetical protein
MPESRMKSTLSVEATSSPVAIPRRTPESGLPVSAKPANVGAKVGQMLRPVTTVKNRAEFAWHVCCALTASDSQVSLPLDSQNAACWVKWTNWVTEMYSKMFTGNELV